MDPKSKEYQEKCNSFIEQIGKTFPDTKFEFKQCESSGHCVIIVDISWGCNCPAITILPDHTWTELKGVIERRITEFPQTCAICHKDRSADTACNKCGDGWCIDCYIDLFTAGRGVIECQSCRHSFGHVLPNDASVCISAGLIRVGHENRERMINL